MIYDPLSVVPLVKRGKRDDFGGRKERWKVEKGERGAMERKSMEERIDREKGGVWSGVGRGEKRREERKRGRERKKERKGGSVREERRKKGSKHLSLKYMKHKNTKSLSNEVELSLYSRCHYLVLSLKSSSSTLNNDK